MNIRIGLLRKKPKWFDERFRDHWRNTYGPLAARAPWDFDGISQRWLESTDTLNEAFALTAGQVMMAHAKTFISDITAFMVVEHRIV